MSLSEDEREVIPLVSRSGRPPFDDGKSELRQCPKHGLVPFRQFGAEGGTVAMGKGLHRLREEAKKCVLVCANCHGEIEAGLVASPPPGTKYPQRDSNPC